MAAEPSQVFPLDSLPWHLLEQAIGFFSYHEIAQLRRVNKRFDTTCMKLLNRSTTSLIF